MVVVVSASGVGGRSSTRRVEPHSLTAQTGASRSGEGEERARRAKGLWGLGGLVWERW